MDENLYKSGKVSLSMKIYQFLKLAGPKSRSEIHEEFLDEVESKNKLSFQLTRMKDKKQIITQRDPRLADLGKKKGHFVFAVRREEDTAAFLKKRGLEVPEKLAQPSSALSVALEPDVVEFAKS